MKHYDANDIAAYQALMAKEKKAVMSVRNQLHTNKVQQGPSQSEIDAYNKMMSCK